MNNTPQLSDILKEQASMMIKDARDRKRRLRQRIRDLMPCQSHDGVRGPNDRPKHLWISSNTPIKEAMLAL